MISYTVKVVIVVLAALIASVLSQAQQPTRVHRIGILWTGQPDALSLQLMSYGLSYEDLMRRSAGYVDRILKGAKPGDLPIEQPTKFLLVVSLSAAPALRRGDICACTNRD